MNRFKRGDAVRVFWNDPHGYPHMYHRPAVIRKKVSPFLYVVSLTSMDREARDKVAVDKWRLDSHTFNVHPSDMIPDASDPGLHLRGLRDKWRAETPPETIAAWERQEAERKRASEAINRRLRPIMARIFATR